MDSLIYPGTDRLWPTRVARVADPPRSPVFVDLTSQNEHYQRNQGTRGYEPQPSRFSKREMNSKDIPVVDNSFSLPQNVFERALASQTRVSLVSTTCPSSPKGFSSPLVNYSASQQQPRHTSGDYVTELTGSEAKRPRLSPPITSEQDLAQRRHKKKLQREQFKLQILRRLDNTKNNILKLLKLQHMQNLVHYYENDPLSNQAGTFGSSQRSELRFHSQQGSTYEKQYQTPTIAPVQNDPGPVSVSPSAQDISRLSHHHSSSHSFRRVPGISIVTNADQWKEQRTSYSYKSSDSVGVAWDHKTLPKIVAVHSVINDANGSATKTVNRATPGSAVGRANHTREKSEIRQCQSQAPVISLTSGFNNRATAMTDRRYSHEDEEVVVTNVLPGRPRCSISTEQQRTNTKSKHNDTSYQNMEITDHPSHVKQSLPTENKARAELSRHFVHPGHTERLRHVDYPGHVENPGHVDHTGHSEHTRRVNVEVVEQIDLTNGDAHTDSSMNIQGIAASASQMETIEIQDHVHPPASLQHPEHADSEVYLGGPPPYLPVLDSSERAEQEKERRSSPETRERRGSNPTSPRLSKTVPEIKEKLMETRERMKNETIEWKKKILYKLEKRLIMKLRRAEGSTGHRTEIDDMQEEGADKGKKRGSPCHDRRSSSGDSVTDSVTDDDDDTPEHTANLPQESENVEKSDDELRKCPQEEKKGKDPVMELKGNCEEVQNEISCIEEEKMEQCEIFARVMKEEKVEECSKRFCNGLEEPLNADEEERNVESDENIVIVDCVTNEHCEEIKFHSEEETRNGSETSCTVRANVTQCKDTETAIRDELSESRRVKSPQESSDFKTECVTLATNANETPKEGTKNLFEAFSSGFQTPALKTDKPQLPENTEQASLITKQEMSSPHPETKEKDTAAETKKLVQRNENLLTNLSSLKKRLQTCSKEVLQAKTENVRCDRNIWSVLERNGIS